MNYQQMNLFQEPDLNDQLSYRGGSLANRIALQESVRHLVTSVIFGPKCGELLATLSRDGLWLKMYEDCFQATMDGSLEELSETFPRWGILWRGELLALHQLEPYIDESEWQLLPTITATDDQGGSIRKKKMFQFANLRNYLHYYYRGTDKRTTWPHPVFAERMMGFPIGWTELNASETQ